MVLVAAVGSLVSTISCYAFHITGIEQHIWLTAAGYMIVDRISPLQATAAFSSRLRDTTLFLEVHQLFFSSFLLYFLRACWNPEWGWEGGGEGKGDEQQRKKKSAGRFKAAVKWRAKCGGKHSSFCSGSWCKKIMVGKKVSLLLISRLLSFTRRISR